MSLPLRFNRRLPADLHDVMAFYERKSGASLANAFYDKLMKRIAEVQENPKQFPFSVGDRRRVNLERFPYHLLYRIKSTSVRILVLRHNHRNPNYGKGTNLGAVEMKDYFLNLSESILDSFGAEQRIDLKLAMENLDLDIDTAIPLGLIVNELLTNTIKYAFPKGEKGTITIKLHKKDNNILRLEVADNGVGKSGITQGTGFGGQLVTLLTQQLNGTMTEESQNGTTLIFDFKLKKAA